MRVLVIAHGEEIQPGWLSDALDEVGAEATVVDVTRSGGLPADNFDRVVVLGGDMGAYDEDEYPWLVGEKAFLSEALAAETPVLGVCLGSQLIADVIGGRAYRAETPEVGLVSLGLTPDGESDPTLGEISGPVAAWHHDTFDLPPSALVLATTDSYPHAFRYGSALGVQFHPEVTPELWKEWTDRIGTSELSNAGLDPEAFHTRLVEDSDRLRKQAIAFFRSWLEETSRT